MDLAIVKVSRTLLWVFSYLWVSFTGYGLIIAFSKCTFMAPESMSWNKFLLFSIIGRSSIAESDYGLRFFSVCIRSCGRHCIFICFLCAYMEYLTTTTTVKIKTVHLRTTPITKNCIPGLVIPWWLVAPVYLASSLPQVLFNQINEVQDNFQNQFGHFTLYRKSYDTIDKTF